MISTLHRKLEGLKINKDTNRNYLNSAGHDNKPVSALNKERVIRTANMGTKVQVKHGETVLK